MKRQSRKALITLLLLLAVPANAAPRWEHIATEDGIRVTSRDVPGRGFPTFRGRGLVKANIYQVLAVLRDTKRHTEWMAACIDARMIKKINEYEYVVYSRTKAPWPVSDRDAVFKSKTTVDRKNLVVTTRFWAVRSKLKPPVDGVVRMTRLRGRYKFTAMGWDKTLVDFKVDANPEGMLPGWIARMASKKIPLVTIQKLRKQARRTKGWYKAQIKVWLKIEPPPDKAKDLPGAPKAAATAAQAAQQANIQSGAPEAVPAPAAQ